MQSVENCGSKGHFARNCTLPRQNDNRQRGNIPPLLGLKGLKIWSENLGLKICRLGTSGPVRNFHGFYQAVGSAGNMRSPLFVALTKVSQ